MLAGVVDTNMVIGLSKGDVFDRLARIYAPLYIPAAVSQEVIQQGQGRAGVTELSTALGAWITDDGKLAREARRCGFACLGAPEVVLLLKRRALIDAVRPILDRMRQQGFGIAEAVYQQTLQVAGE
jgi:predicted nucleic acid-binding protein